MLTSTIYKPLRVLIVGLNFKRFTGSELYMYDLAVGLTKLKCQVTIASWISDPLKSMAESYGINVINFNDLTGNEFFDIIHCQHTNITKKTIELYPRVPKIMTIHSEIISLENPVKHQSILKYISVRKTITNKLINSDKIPLNKIELIYNPIDTEKFNEVGVTFNKYLLFVGTIDYLRKETIFDLVKYTKVKKYDLYLVGRNNSEYLYDLLENEHVKYFEETNQVEKFVKGCMMTASIMLGRTLIEGWLCNKPGLLYNVDSTGKILSRDQIYPPDDILKYDRDYVSTQIKELYLGALK